MYGCEITKKDKKFREICTKQATKIIREKIKLLKKISELNFSIDIKLITKFVKALQINFVLIFLKGSKSNRFFKIF